jgi:hypothetical protein
MISASWNALVPIDRTRPKILLMNLFNGRSFVVVMGVFACVTTGCFSCSETVHETQPKVDVQPAPFVVAPAPFVVAPQ